MTLLQTLVAPLALARRPRPASRPAAAVAEKAAGGRAYFVNAPVDFLVMGGASLLAFAAFRLFHSGARDAWVILLGAQLTWVCNWPHFAATSMRLYRSPATIRQFPLTAVAAPLLMALGVAAALAWPTAFAPYFLKVYALWSPYHFSGQTVGISMVYARRTGVALSATERRLLGAFVFSTFLYPSLRAEEALTGFTDGPVYYPSFGIGHGLVQAAEGWLTLCAVLWLAVIVRKSIQQRRLVHPLFILPALTQFVWFIPGAGSASFQEFVPFFHSLQYLAIAWSMQLKERLDATGAAPGRRFVATQSLRWGALVIALGAGLFYGLPRLVATAGGVSLLLAITVVQAGVQLHHFFVDGIIWKLRHRSVASPLAVTIHDLIGH